jgi:ABC-type uncharacterized transport system fused permease/ATPase subunit
MKAHKTFSTKIKRNFPHSPMNNRALSQLMGAMILVIITASISTLIYIWSANYTNMLIEQQQAFTISNVKYYMLGASYYLNVTITNIGYSIINITSAHLYNINGSSTNTTIIFSSFIVNPGQTVTQKFMLSHPLTKGQTYILEISTNKGYSVSFTFSP